MARPTPNQRINHRGSQRITEEDRFRLPHSVTLRDLCGDVDVAPERWIRAPRLAPRDYFTALAVSSPIRSWASLYSTDDASAAMPSQIFSASARFPAARYARAASAL